MSSDGATSASEDNDVPGFNYKHFHSSHTFSTDFSLEIKIIVGK